MSDVRLCDAIDCNPPGASVYGVSQARILEWVATSSFRGSSRPRDRTRMSSAMAGRFFFLPLAPAGKPTFAPEMPRKKRDPFSQHFFFKFKSFQLGCTRHFYDVFKISPLCSETLADTCLLLLTSVSVLFISEDAYTLLLGLVNGLPFPAS